MKIGIGIVLFALLASFNPVQAARGQSTILFITRLIRLQKVA